MRPLICPQCGGQIDEYAAGAAFTVCEYCGTKFLVDENKLPRVVAAPVDPPELETEDPTAAFRKVLAGALIAIVVVIVISVFATKTQKSPTASATTFASRTTPSPTPVVTPT